MSDTQKELDLRVTIKFPILDEQFDAVLELPKVRVGKWALLLNKDYLMTIILEKHNLGS